MVAKTHSDKDDGENDEAHELDGFSANGVNRCNGNPITGDGTRTNDNKIADRGV